MRRKKVQESDFTEDEETTDGEKGVLTYQDFPTGPSSRKINDETAITISAVNDQLPPTEASADKEAEGDPKEISINAGLTEITATICKPISNNFAAIHNEISVVADKELLAVEDQDNVTGKNREMLGSPSPTNKEPSGYCDQLNDSNSQDSMEIESEEDLDSSEKVSNILQSADTADASPIIDGPSVSHTQCLQNLNQDNFSDAENDETAVDCYSSGKLEK
ncbi:uncharacterized protein LOC116415750 [Nasonia vitripennis]|uniref:Uncharacterized protein n=1 Tax=Nasonia vitripennis TaxID=7425 RepID=A0A7M7PUQ1_NASVI|nr:uncharacterized protein LOC116415750 [Nasonia vitripennis]